MLNWRLNDSYADDPHIGDQAGPAVVSMNTGDADRIGVEDGARLRNETGAVELVMRRR